MKLSWYKDNNREEEATSAKRLLINKVSDFKFACLSSGI